MSLCYLVNVYVVDCLSEMLKGYLWIILGGMLVSLWIKFVDGFACCESFNFFKLFFIFEGGFLGFLSRLIIFGGMYLEFNLLFECYLLVFEMILFFFWVFFLSNLMFLL